MGAGFEALLDAYQKVHKLATREAGTDFWQPPSETAFVENGMNHFRYGAEARDAIGGGRRCLANRRTE